MKSGVPSLSGGVQKFWSPCESKEGSSGVSNESLTR